MKGLVTGLELSSKYIKGHMISMSGAFWAEKFNLTSDTDLELWLMAGVIAGRQGLKCCDNNSPPF